MEQLKKYELVQSDTVQTFNRITLYRVRALRDFADVTAGDFGGYVQSADNLSHSGNAWVFGNAQVYGDALVYGNAQVYGNTQVYEDAQVYGNARVSGDTLVYGNAQVYGNTQVYEDALVSGNAQVYGNTQVYRGALVYGNARVSGNAQVRFGATSLAPVAVSGGRYACTMLPGVGASIGCQDFLPEHLTSTEVFRAECDKRGYLVTAEESALIRALWCVAEVTYANS